MPFVGSTELSSEFIARGARPASGPPLSQGKELARAGPQEIELSQKTGISYFYSPKGGWNPRKKSFLSFLISALPQGGRGGAGRNRPFSKRARRCNVRGDVKKADILRSG